MLTTSVLASFCHVRAEQTQTNGKVVHAAPFEDPDQASSSAFVPTQLRCEYRTDPLGVDAVRGLKSNSPDTIVVQKASYGVLNDPTRTRDVKTKVQELVDSGETDFAVASLAAGDDPASGVVKTLKIDYTLAGNPKTVSGQDPDTIRLEHTDPPPHPRLGWILQPGNPMARGLSQSAYQILVASSPDMLAKNKGDLWDSGKAASNQQSQIAYAGQPLTSWTKCYWKARVWDQDGKPSAWSEPATWTMGILKPEDWKGDWITYPDQKTERQSTLLRQEFDVKSGLKRATVVVCGLGQYEMALNGKKVSDDLLTPGWSKYNKTCLYDMDDVTSSLQTGKNCVGILLGNGMYNVKANGRYAKFEGSFGPQKAIAQIRLEYLDGTTEYISTSGDWRAHPGPITFSSIYGGEDYDARLYEAGWDQAGFDDHAWTPSLVTTGPGGALKGTSCSGPPIRRFETFQPVKTTQIKPGVTLYDFGQNAAQMPAITVSGPAGSTVTMSPSELLNAGKDIDQGSTGSPISYTYTLAGRGDETWSPRFFYSGYRYLKIESSPAPGGGDLPKIKEVKSHVVHSSSARAGEFTTSNDLINRIYAMVRWAQLNNMMSILTDCPHREKLGWLEEAHLNGPSLRYDFDMNALFRKIMNDMAHSQVENGLIPDTAPEYPVFGGEMRDSAQWGSAFIQVAGQQYQFTGDTSLLERYYNQMARYIAYLVQNVHHGILDGGLGDWRTLEASPNGVTNNAILYQDAMVMALCADLLGKKEDAAHYRDLANQLRTAYNKAYFDPQNKQYSGGNQTAAGVALDLNFVAEGDRHDVVANLAKCVQLKGNKSGEIGFPYLLRALAKGGRSDVIYAMINQTDKPGYGYQLAHGSTSMPEDWDFQPSASQDHFMLGQIVEWFYHDLAGIQCDPDAVGFHKIIIKPAIVGDLTWVKASYDSISGKIVSEWKRDGQTVTLHVVIPANTIATIVVPADDASHVIEEGGPASSSPGVKFLKIEGGVASYQVGSGTYDFHSTLPVAPLN